MTEPPIAPDRASSQDFPSRGQSRLAAAKHALAIAFGLPETRDFDVRFWDGSLEGGAVSPPRFTIIVRRPGALRRALLPPSELALVEAYLRDDLDIDGDIESAGTLGDRAASNLRSLRAVVSLGRALRALPVDDVPRNAAGNVRAMTLVERLRGHTKRGDAAMVRHHYDVGNDFYSLWLDRRMLYSCAYFPTGNESIDEAQEKKVEHICRKLRLRAGDRLLDIGCGWGGLLDYAATRYGVEGTGITLSERQAEVARKRLADAGVSDRIRIEVRSYRELDPAWRFDKVVSVGMREHVGARHLPDYFAAVFAALKPGGLFLDHGIVRSGAFGGSNVLSWIARYLWRRDAFISRYVFPGGELVPLGPLTTMAEKTGLETRDVENLREHYVRTLHSWVSRLERAHARAVELVGEHTYRVWRLYMAATAIGFRTGRLTLIQTLFAKPTEDGSASVPLSRADLHRA